MYLNGTQIQSFVEALNKAFTLNRLDQLLLGRLDKDRESISLKPDKISILFDVVDTANREGWALKLLFAARSSNANNPHLVEFQESLELGVTRPADINTFEKIVNERSTFVNVMAFRERLGSLESWVCAIEIPNSGGTGYLVQSDLVLTNYHVIEDILDGNISREDVKCRFDYKASADGSVVNPGTAVGLANDWDVARAPYSEADTNENNQNWGPEELDFALVRLERAIGNEPIGSKPELGAPIRAWHPLTQSPATVADDDVVFILQHPQDLSAPVAKLQPMQLSNGIILGFAGNGVRVRHNARTLPGSSGSPLFNANLDFAAIHHAGEPNSRLDFKGAYNQAIPLPKIIRYLVDEGHDDLLAH